MFPSLDASKTPRGPWQRPAAGPRAEAPRGSCREGPCLERSLTDSALAALAAKVGSMRGLPELQMFVNDTVTSTLHSLRGIVENHVRRVMVQDQLGTVEKMVIHCITEEVIRVTAQSGEQIARRELGNVDLNLERLAERVAGTEAKLQLQVAAGRDEVRRQSELAQQAASELGAALSRITALERQVCELQVLPALLETLQRQMHTVSSAGERTAERLTSLQQDVKSNAEHASREYARVYALTQFGNELRELKQHVAAHGDDWMQSKIKAFVTVNEVKRQLETLDERRVQELSQTRSELFEHVEAIRQEAAAKHEALARTAVMPEGLAQVHRVQDAARAALDLRLHDELASLTVQCRAAMQVPADVAALRAEQGEHFESLHVELAKSSKGIAKLGEAQRELQSHLHQLAEDLSILQRRAYTAEGNLGGFENDFMRLKQAFSDAGFKVDAIMKHQQLNRKELNYITAQCTQLENMAAELRVVKAQGHDNAVMLQQYGDGPAQSEEKGSSTHAYVRSAVDWAREAARINQDLEELREAMGQLRQQQALGFADLQALSSVCTLSPR